MIRVSLLVLLALSARPPAAAQTRSSVSSTAARFTLRPGTVSVSFPGPIVLLPTAHEAELAPSLAAAPTPAAAPAPVPAPQAAAATPVAVAQPAPLPRALLDANSARIVSASGPGVDFERLAPVESALRSARRLRELLDPESARGAKGMALAAAELDALFEAAPRARALSDLLVRATDRPAPGFSMPWPRYYAGLLRQAPKLLAASRPEPGGGWRGALDRVVSRRAEKAFWRRLSEAGRPVPRGGPEREAWLATAVDEAAAAARAGAPAEAPGEALLRVVGPAIRAVAKEASQAPYIDAATGRQAMRRLGSSFATLIHYAEPALGSSLAEEYGQALRAAVKAYDERGTLASSILHRYADKEYLAESFWETLRFNFVPGVPDGERSRRAWMQAVIESFD